MLFKESFGNQITPFHWNQFCKCIDLCLLTIGSTDIAVTPLGPESCPIFFYIANQCRPKHCAGNAMLNVRQVWILCFIKQDKFGNQRKKRFVSAKPQGIVNLK